MGWRDVTMYGVHIHGGAVGFRTLRRLFLNVVELELPVWSMVGEDGHEDGWTWEKLKKLTLGGGTDGYDRRGYAPEELTWRGVVNSGAPGGFYNAYRALLKRFSNLRRLEAMHVIASNLWKDGGRVNVSERLEKEATTKEERFRDSLSCHELKKMIEAEWKVRNDTIFAGRTRRDTRRLTFEPK
jgi:hypothetical protein